MKDTASIINETSGYRDRSANEDQLHKGLRILAHMIAQAYLRDRRSMDRGSRQPNDDRGAGTSMNQEAEHMNWKEHKKQLIKDREFRKEYEALEPAYKLAAALIQLRLSKGLTQEELARVSNIKQASIARLESGSSLLSLSMVKKVADALDAELEIRLQPRHQPAQNFIRQKI
jgi:DNA-binding XRE family transcriptional regulator